MRKRLLLITLAICLLVLGINLITRGENLSGRVRDMIVDKARQELGYEVGMDKLVFNFFPSYIDLKGLYLKGWDPKDKDNAITVDEARLYFSLAALTHREINIRRIRLSSPRSSIVRYEDGSYNLDALITNIKRLGEEEEDTSEQTKAFSFHLREVVVFDGDGLYTDLGRGFKLTYSSAAADLRLFDDGRYRLGLNVEELAALRKGMPAVKMSISGDALYSGNAVNMEGVRIKAGRSTIASSGEVKWGKETALKVELDSEVDLKLLETVGLIAEGPSGMLTVKGVVEGTYPELKGDGSFRLDGFTYRTLELGSFSSDIEFVDGKLALTNLAGGAYGGRVEGNATLDLSGGEVRHVSTLRIRDVMTGQYTGRYEDLKFIPWYTVSGLVNMSGTGTDIASLAADGSIKLVRSGPAYQRQGENADLAVIRQVSADFRLFDEIIDVSACKVEAEHTVANLKGAVGLNWVADMTLSGRSTDIDEISTMIGYSDMDGSLDFTGTVNGYVLDPTIKGKARFSNASAGKVAFPSAFGDVELSGWDLKFTDFTILPEKGSFTLNGGIRFQGDGAEFMNPRFDAKLKTHGADVRKIVSIFYGDLPINVFADGTIEFHGNLDHFGGEADLVTGEGDVYGQPVDKGEVLAVLTENDISFPRVIAVKGRDVVTGTGAIRFDGTFDGKISSSRFELANFALLMGTGVPVRGSASFSITGSGPFSDAVINGNISAYSLYLKDVDLGEASLDVSIKDDILKGEGSLLDNKVRFDGYFEFNEPMRWMGRLAFDNGRFEPFVRMVYDRLPEDVSLVATGQLTARGAAGEEGSEKVAVNFTHLAANIMGSRLENDGDIVFSYEGERVSVGSMKLKGEDVGLEVTGGAASLDELSFRVKAAFDLSSTRKMLEDAVDFIDGSCRMDVRISGSASDPVATGKAAVTGGAVKFKGFPQRFDDVHGEMKLDGKVFELTKMEAELGGGNITLTGSGGLRGVLPDNYSFTVTASDVRLKYPEELVSTVDAKLYAEGAGGKNSVSGDIVIKKARYSKRVEWKSWLVQFRQEARKAGDAEPPPMSDIALNIRITGDESIKVDNNVAKLSITPDLIVRGTAGQPVLLGRLEATSGKVYFRNNEFRLNNAVAEFADPARLNPIIDLQAETNVREYLIQLTLTGTLDRVKVMLLSDPPLEDADIITLLTLGRTSEGIEGHESALTTGEAASFVTGQIQDAVEERLTRIAGFDRFQIDPYLTSKGVSSGPRLTVGKRMFSDKLYITFSSNLGTSEEQLIRLEYMINKNLSLVGERDELGRFGGDVKLRFEFK